MRQQQPVGSGLQGLGQPVAATPVNYTPDVQQHIKKPPTVSGGILKGPPGDSDTPQHTVPGSAQPTIQFETPLAQLRNSADPTSKLPLPNFETPPVQFGTPPGTDILQQILQALQSLGGTGGVRRF